MQRIYTSTKDSGLGYHAYIEVWSKGTIHWYSKTLNSQELRRRWIKDKLLVLALMPPQEDILEPVGKASS